MHPKTWQMYIQLEKKNLKNRPKFWIKKTYNLKDQTWKKLDLKLEKSDLNNFFQNLKLETKKLVHA